MQTDAPILIAGGGIGGLSAALALAQKGYRCTVLEKSAQFGEIGAGIQLGPNAFAVFQHLGVLDQVMKVAVLIDDLRLMDALSGQEITRIPLDGPFRKRFVHPYAVVHRGQMHKVLLNACADSPLVELRTSAGVEHYESHETGVTAQLSNGQQMTGAVLIGADGLWSNVRAQMLDDGPPRVSGHSTYRSVISADDMPDALRWNSAALWGGPKCHIVHYPLYGGDRYNLVVTFHNDAPEPVAGRPVGVDEVRRGFEHVCDAAREIIERGENWKHWVLCDREPVLQWSEGCVALLGDAAHPTLQYWAQGACMAMEDAVMLAAQLKGAEDAPTGLRAYCEARRARTARVTLQSRAIGDHIYHPEGAHAELRNQVMQARSPQDWYDQIAWLYGADPLASAVSSETL